MAILKAAGLLTVKGQLLFSVCERLVKSSVSISPEVTSFWVGCSQRSSQGKIRLGARAIWPNAYSYHIYYINHRLERAGRVKEEEGGGGVANRFIHLNE